jgi:hypothetical protein
MKTGMHRRRFLKGVGVGLALPMLESFKAPSLLAASATGQVKRLVCIGTYLGFHRDHFFPKQTGKSFDMPSVLEPLADFREKLSIFSGLDHRGRNGHEGWKAWMSGSASGSVSMDQLVADHVGKHTRYASMQLTCGAELGGAQMSFTKEGVALPMIGRPSVFYQTLFRSDSDKSRIEYVLKGNSSILDDVLEEAKSIQRQVSQSDQQKLDEYLSSLRDVEKKLQKQEAWLEKPYPKTNYPLPTFDPVSPEQTLHCETIMYDLMALALTTDSTRVMTFMIPGMTQVFEIEGERLSTGYHALSHHGNQPEKIAEYNRIGREHVKSFAKFVSTLEAHRDAEGKSILDSTAIVYGSGMGDSNTHDNTNLPTLVAGGGLNHGNHWAHDRNSSNLRLLGDLYISVMQQLGMDVDQFAGANRNLNECFSS